MAQVPLPEVFTAREVARATGLNRRRVQALIASGQVRTVQGTAFIPEAEAITVGRRFRSTRTQDSAGTAGPASARRASAELFSESFASPRRAGMPAVMSTLVHAMLVAAAFWLTTLDVGTAPTEERLHEPARLVFLVTPGPGGGGGGGGLRNPLPPPKIQRRGPERRKISVPAVTPKPAVTTARNVEPPPRPTPAPPPPVEPRPATREPEPLSSRVLVAPVVTAAADTNDREGVIEGGRGGADSQGPGSGGGAGSGRGTGNGEGDGSGIGPGSGGGTGGGPYRPGSGVEPPRLLREVKAEYTEDARRRGITGDVVLEIVVRRDGSVGDVRIMQGLGAGLDQRAVQAVRQWRFDPARRQGVAVDVLVEVAVEFMLR
jgi:TonB family protein